MRELKSQGYNVEFHIIFVSGLVQAVGLFLTTFRRTPTANAEGLDRIGGQHRKGLERSHSDASLGHFRPTRALGVRRRHCYRFDVENRGTWYMQWVCF